MTDIDIKNIIKYIKFVAIAEWGAMGAAGEIELLCRKDGINTRCFGNMFFGKKIIDMDKLKKSFPEIKDMNCFMFPCEYAFSGWKYFNLGFGNNLYVAEDVCNYFELLTDSLPPSKLYASLYEYAFTILVLLENGYTNEKDFLKYYRENIISKNELEYVSVDINDKINKGYR